MCRDHPQKTSFLSLFVESRKFETESSLSRKLAIWRSLAIKKITES
jgi:hypothetical protein